MPAINVARTDTFETQRQKINQIGTQIFNVTSGGSDLAAGNIKLGDGTQGAPSLAFDTDNTLGFYKPRASTIGYVASNKKLLDITSENLLFYKNFAVRQEKVAANGITFLNFGSNYDAGSYTGILLTGGSGSSAVGDFIVTEFDGTLVAGAGYSAGVFTGIVTRTISGTGSGATVDFEVPGITGAISNAGTGYKPGAYTSVPLTGGNGTGAEADITISGDTVITGSINNAGTGYTTGVYSNVAVFNVPTQTFVVTANGTTNFLMDGTADATLNLVKGNTYRFDVSDSSMASHQLGFQLTGGGFIGAEFIVLQSGNYGSAGGFVDLIITDVAGSGAYEYYCVSHTGMEAVMNVGTGAGGTFGRFALADVTVDAGGVVTAFAFSAAGVGYKTGDNVTADPSTTGGGSGFVFNLSSLSFNSTIDSVVITDDGSGYTNGDVLGANDSDLGSGGGSNFAFTIDNDPGIPINFLFQSKGTGYATGDEIGLPFPVTGVTTTLRSIVQNISATLSTATATITVASTAGILAGMEVYQDVNDVGALFPNTTVASVTNATTIVLSDNPVGDGAATLEFRSVGAVDEITVSSTTGISPGSTVTQTAGTGVLGTNITVSSVIDATTLLLSGQPTTAGSATLSFTPPYGTPTTDLVYTVGNLGVVDSFSLSDGGIGYTLEDVLSVDPTDLVQPITYTVTAKTLQRLTFASSTYNDGIFTVGASVKERAGSITSASLVSGTTLAGQASQTYNNVSHSGGNGSGATFDVVRDASGNVISITITNNGGGFNYQDADQLTILGTAVGGAAPTDNLTVNVDSVTSSTDLEIAEVVEAGGYTVSILVDSGGILTNDVIVPATGTPTPYTVDVASAVLSRYFIDTGSGAQLTPNLTLYSGSTYTFDTSDTSLAPHSFAFSAFRDGTNEPSLVPNIATTLSTSTAQITVASTAGILAGMTIIEVSNTGGQLIAGTTVLSVDNATTLTLSKVPLAAGGAVLSFQGTSYVDGVTFGVGSVTIKPADNTPTLYYYDSLGTEDLGGEDSVEATITINQNNPKVFGSGFSARVAVLDTTDVVSGSIADGVLNALSLTGTSANITDVTVGNQLTATAIETTSAAVSSITSSAGDNNITLAATTFAVNANVNIGTTIQIDNAAGDITTSGNIKTTNKFNSNDLLFVQDNVISSATSTDLELTPAATRVAKINGVCGLTIPSGPTTDRPIAGVVSDGTIRFNTTTNQYEGYSNTTTTWSSLGGVRDLDGNTYILAEETVGANDNTLWFINDGINTIKFTPAYQEFRSVKKIRSANTTAPNFVDWTSNTPVLVGAYLKWKNYLYEVTSAGTTGTSGNEPIHTSGAVNNGSAELTFWGSTVGPLTFEDIDELRIGPSSPTDLVINSDLRLKDNIVSTDVSDIVLRPNLGKRLIVDALTSIVIPSGGTTDRGTAQIGAVRYNTTDTQFEGYNGADWTSLGGVRDVDGNTYIVPETAPGQNENILYFYNDNNNTLQLTTTALDFYSVDTLRSVTTDEFEITASLLTIDQAATTLDNTAADRTFLHTSKQYFDLGLSGGLNVDPVLRLDNQGDVYFNTNFGNGNFQGVKIFDGDLKEFELSDVRILTEKLTLIKDTVDNVSSTLYSTALEAGCKTIVVAENPTSGDKEFIEFGVIDNGSDVYHTEYGNNRTGEQLIIPTFSYSGANTVILNLEVGANVATSNSVNITVTSTITKK